VGRAPDAEAYGDAGANTLRHILEKVPGLRLRALESLGLMAVLDGTNGTARTHEASFGRMRERSAGKDTTTGHWEIAGVILEEPFATFVVRRGESRELGTRASYADVAASLAKCFGVREDWAVGEPFL
jgi:phosphopentomutase